MLQESAFIPFETSPLPAGPWLVFAPHADDETYGMGGTILRAADEDIDVHLIVLTDGALGGNSKNIVATRRREAQRACRFLGIESLQCWNESDRGLKPGVALIARVAEAIRKQGPAAVFFPAAYEPHPDHRATALIVWAALSRLLSRRKTGPRPQPMSYEIGVQSPINLLIDISAVMRRKQQAMEIYGSQNAENDYPDLVTALDRARTFTLPGQVQYAEAFHRFPVDAPAQSFRYQTDLYYDKYWR